MELLRQGLSIHLTVHPVIGDDAFIHVEVDREGEGDVLTALERDLLRVLTDVRDAVEDWAEMESRVDDVLRRLDTVDLPVDREELAEAKAFLQWLKDDHFTLLGFREYELVVVEDEDILRSVPGTGLGILRQ